MAKVSSIDKKRKKTTKLSSAKAVSFTQSVGFALEGIRSAFRTERNFRIDVAMCIATVMAGVYFNISPSEWIAIVIVMGLVFSVELLNTAIEYLVDYSGNGKRDPKLKIVKDVAAGACLLAALTAFTAGMIIFLPKLLSSGLLPG